jgi:hypothetical protein
MLDSLFSAATGHQFAHLLLNHHFQQRRTVDVPFVPSRRCHEHDACGRMLDHTMGRRKRWPQTNDVVVVSFADNFHAHFRGYDQSRR